jgi:membrane protein YdbS with pleckstrin-like domain
MTYSTSNLPPDGGTGAVPNGQPHRPAGNTEEVYFEGSPVVRAELFKAIVLGLIGLVLIALPVLAWARDWTWWPGWLGVVTILLGILLIVLPAVFTRTTRYRITNYRIDYERGVLSKQIDTLELWHVDDLSLHQSLADRMLNTGTITIVSNDSTTPKLALRALPNPRPLFDTLKQRVIAVKRQRGVIKMDT